MIGAKDIKNYQYRKDAVLLDLRDWQEYREYHIKGAVNVPVQELERYMENASKDRVYIFCCQHGSMSIQEGKRYGRKGYQICSLAGGITTYRQIFKDKNTWYD
jgi:rhodanese-related sulfurtransferase